MFLLRIELWVGSCFMSALKKYVISFWPLYFVMKKKTLSFEFLPWNNVLPLSFRIFFVFGVKKLMMCVAVDFFGVVLFGFTLLLESRFKCLTQIWVIFSFCFFNNNLFSVFLFLPPTSFCSLSGTNSLLDCFLFGQVEECILFSTSLILLSLWRGIPRRSWGQKRRWRQWLNSCCLLICPDTSLGARQSR